MDAAIVPFIMTSESYLPASDKGYTYNSKTVKKTVPKVLLTSQGGFSNRNCNINFMLSIFFDFLLLHDKQVPNSSFFDALNEVIII